jgi:hypothetical protein
LVRVTETTAHHLCRQQLLRQDGLLELEHTDAILSRINEPGNQRKTYVGDVINSIQARQVIFLNLYAL